MYLAGARWYAPDLYRWMSRDPIEYAGGDNMFAYVAGNPVKYVDPSGLDFKLPKNPSGLGPEWKRDLSHRDPYGERYVDSSGRPLDFHQGRPNDLGWKAKDHWHDRNNFGSKHLEPGCKVPDPAPLAGRSPSAHNPKPNGEILLPWWMRLPTFLPPVPFFVIPRNEKTNET